MHDAMKLFFSMRLTKNLVRTSFSSYKVFSAKSLLLWFCFEIVKQSIKRLLIIVVAFPATEVTDIPCTSNIGCPCLICMHDTIIETDWK